MSKPIFKCFGKTEIPISLPAQRYARGQWRKMCDLAHWIRTETEELKVFSEEKFPGQEVLERREFLDWAIQLHQEENQPVEFKGLQAMTLMRGFYDKDTDSYDSSPWSACGLEMPWLTLVKQCRSKGYELVDTSNLANKYGLVLLYSESHPKEDIPQHDQVLYPFIWDFNRKHEDVLDQMGYLTDLELQILETRDKAEEKVWSIQDKIEEEEASLERKKARLLQHFQPIKKIQLRLKHIKSRARLRGVPPLRPLQLMRGVPPL